MALSLISASCLAVALLVPLRDGRRGKRATLSGDAPLTPHFPPSLPGGDESVAVPSAVSVRFPPDPPNEPIGPRDAPGAEADAGAEPSSDVQVSSDPLSRKRGASSLRTLGSAFLPRTADVAQSEPSLDTETGDATLSAHTFAEEVALAMRGDVTTVPAIPIAATTAPRALADGARPPLTRLPLRPHREITWTIAAAQDGANWTEGDRLAYLRECARTCDATLVPALCHAYEEESAAGRLFALRALGRHRGEASLGVFREALVRGADDERAVVVDILDAWGERDVLSEALCDRVDAIAARAALAFVGGRDRAAFETALAPFVDRTRLNTILALLAGILD